ncbi:MAG: PIN domain-containing protein [archaeon]
MYVDLDLIYAKIKKDDRLQETSRNILKSKERQYTSVITLLELELVLKREISDYLSKESSLLFIENFPKIKIVGFSQKIFEKSLELRKKYDFGAFDSIHAATALLFDKRIATTDNAFERVPNLKVIRE